MSDCPHHHPDCSCTPRPSKTKFFNCNLKPDFSKTIHKRHNFTGKLRVWHGINAGSEHEKPSFSTDKLVFVVLYAPKTGFGQRSLFFLGFGCSWHADQRMKMTSIYIYIYMYYYLMIHNNGCIGVMHDMTKWLFPKL